MSPKSYCIGALVLVVATLTAVDGSAPPKSKRQIYREQVLPSKGGKIPEDAFRTDRLALNRLNKEGISIPDGVLLEHRNVHSHPHINQHDPEDEDSLIKIIQRPEDRYVAPPGKYDKRPFTVASTYIIRKPIGAESAAIRAPLDQTPYHESFGYNQGNQIYQIYPDGYYQQQYVPPQKYLPAQLTAPPQKYLPVEITVPPRKYFPAPSDFTSPPANVIHHPHPYGYSAPVSYQQVHQSVAYYPIPVPLQLPNKETTKDGYYSVKSQEGYHREGEDIDGVVDWPYLLKQYTQLSDKINVLDSYSQPTPHSLFLGGEVLGPVDSGSRYYATRERYARKSKEIAFTDSPPETSGKNRQKDRRRLIKLKCTSRLENSVEDGSSQCFIRY